MHVPAQLVSEVLALPPAARVELIALLQESLPIQEAPGEVVSDDEITAEWTEELDRRIAKSRSGESPGIEVEAALDLIRKQLASSHGARGV